MPRVLLPPIFLFLFLSTKAQEYNYVHYDTKDGLAGNTVYSVIQDKKGYIWFGTDNGISRFDGKVFRNFTTDDGVPDNEVLSLFADSENRVWIAPFNKSLSYFYEGKVHRVDIDTLLSQGIINTYISITGEIDGSTYFSTANGLFKYTPENKLVLVGDFRKYCMYKEASSCNSYVFLMRYMNPKTIFVLIGQNIYETSKDSLRFIKQIDQEQAKNFSSVADIEKDLTLKFWKNSILPAHTTRVDIGKNRQLFNSSSGSWMLDAERNITSGPYLPGKKISHSVLDREGNLWFATLGEGVYRLTTGALKTFLPNKEVLCIEKYGDSLLFGQADGQMGLIHSMQLQKEYVTVHYSAKSNTKRLFTMKSDGNGGFYLGYDSHLELKTAAKTIVSEIRPIKSIDLAGKDHIIVGTNFAVMRLNKADLRIVDTLLDERGTKVLYSGNTYLFGTLSGLITVDSSGNIVRTATRIHELSNRIADILQAGDGSYWVATNDYGVIQYQNDRVKKVINYSNGLSSNGCKSLFLKGDHLWAGTNKGINKIDIQTGKVIARYSVADGLPSDIINALYVDDSLVWVASPGGLTFFNEKNMSGSSMCDLDLQQIFVSGEPTDSNHLKLGYRQNNISFSYTAISFKSSGDITYYYKLTGLDNEWKTTSLPTLSYPSLPAGSYTFSLYAVNKFGKRSETINIAFSIAAPFWKTVPFWLIISLSLAALTAWFVTRRFRNLEQRTKEKNDLNRKISELEQASMRAQMNPHFIFNCLNSIQHFIIKNDIEKTNQYITQFASLIRQTLDNAARTNIPIADEIRYLTSYMELEGMRFPDAFSYSFKTDAALQTDYVCVPSMILQPFVENAIRHGIRNKDSGKGEIKITILQNNEGVHFTVEDNGVGREAAARLKSDQHIEYQSKGIRLATNRLELLSAGNHEPIITHITDMKDDTGNAIGTKVEVFFPHSILQKLN